MSSLSSKCLPENIRRRMAPETRKELDAPTQPEADAKHDAKREKVLQEQIANLLRQRNIVFFRQRMDKRTTGRVGQPDFIFAINGRACACECKVGNGRLTPEQALMQVDLVGAGWHWCVARSLDDFRNWLDDVSKEVANA